MLYSDTRYFRGLKPEQPKTKRRVLIPLFYMLGPRYKEKR